MGERNQAAIDLLDKWLREPQAKTVKHYDPYIWFGYFHRGSPLYLLPTVFYDPPSSVQRVIDCPDYQVTLCWLRFGVSFGIKVHLAVTDNACPKSDTRREW